MHCKIYFSKSPLAKYFSYSIKIDSCLWSVFYCFKWLFYKGLQVFFFLIPFGHFYNFHWLLELYFCFIKLFLKSFWIKIIFRIEYITIEHLNRFRRIYAWNRSILWFCDKNHFLLIMNWQKLVRLFLFLINSLVFQKFYFSLLIQIVVWEIY